MTRRKLPLALAGLGLFGAQPPMRPSEVPPEDDRLPDGRSKSGAILKRDYESNLKDLDEIQRLSDLVKKDLKRNEGHVLSLSNLKNLEEIEKIAKRIRGRMRRL
jgi:hypothetical protein